MRKYNLLFLCIIFFAKIHPFNCLTNNSFLKKMRLIVLASKPGSGKGTFSQTLVKNFKNFTHIDAGELERSEMRAQTKFGKEIEFIYKAKGFSNNSLDKQIWDKLICPILINSTSTKSNITILDGCLCSEKNFEITDSFIKNSLLQEFCIIQLLTKNETCQKRILGRRICPKCHTIFNTSFFKQENCLYCNEKLYIRKSDTKEYTLDRLEQFECEVLPIIKRVKKSYNFLEIDTECSIEELKEKYIKLFKLAGF